MKVVIFIFMFLISVLKNSICLAEVVLVPAKSVDFSDYLEKCTKTGYICTNQYFLNKIQTSDTPLFDDLINKIDLSSSEFIMQFEKNLINVLESEMISVEQLEMVLKLTSQILDLKTDKKLIQIIEIDLKTVNSLLTSIDSPKEQQEFVVLFKKAVTLNQIKNLKINSFKVPIAKLHFTISPIHTNLRTLNTNPANNFNSVVLLDGECEKQTIHSSLANVNWSAFTGQHCSLSESLTSATESTAHFYQENKKLIIGSAILVGAVLLLNKYELQFQF